MTIHKYRDVIEAFADGTHIEYLSGRTGWLPFVGQHNYLHWEGVYRILKVKKKLAIGEFKTQTGVEYRVIDCADKTQIQDENCICRTEAVEVSKCVIGEPHVHAKAIKAWANGEQIGYRASIGSELIPVKNPIWARNVIYEVIPSTIHKVAKMKTATGSVTTKYEIVESSMYESAEMSPWFIGWCSEEFQLKF